jgi:hypothetical protein
MRFVTKGNFYFCVSGQGHGAALVPGQEQRQINIHRSLIAAAWRRKNRYPSSQFITPLTRPYR